MPSNQANDCLVIADQPLRNRAREPGERRRTSRLTIDRFCQSRHDQLTRYIANNYARKGIRANCISLGGFFDSQPQAFVDAYCSRVPIGRMMERDDIKGAVVFLASDASQYVNGANLIVDGGWTAL